MITKQRTRYSVLTQRNAIPEPIREEKSRLICCQLQKLIEDSVGLATKINVALYASMKSEVDLASFIEAAYQHAATLCFPCMVREENREEGAPCRMAFFPVTVQQYDEVFATFLAHPVRGFTLGELEHAGLRQIAPSQLDAVVVPLVAFDSAGNRLGYGGGNYDRLLPLLRADSLVVGVAFAEQRIACVPCEPHDTPLPHIISA